jgi:hypothetical protein
MGTRNELKVGVLDPSPQTQLRRHFPQVFRHGRLEIHSFPTHGMDERQALGMEPEAPTRDRSAVERVSVDGVPDGREMDPDLVRPPRLEPYH